LGWSSAQAMSTSSRMCPSGLTSPLNTFTATSRPPCSPPARRRRAAPASCHAQRAALPRTLLLPAQQARPPATRDRPCASSVRALYTWPHGRNAALRAAWGGARCVTYFNARLRCSPALPACHASGWRAERTAPAQRSVQAPGRTHVAAKTSPLAPAPSGAPMATSAALAAVAAGVRGGGRAQTGLPASDIQHSEGAAPSSSGTCHAVGTLQRLQHTHASAAHMVGDIHTSTGTRQ